MSGNEAAGVGLERTLDRSYYQSDDIFARERERIFFSEWFCVGREEEVADTGDYAVKQVAGESILVVRRKDGGLAAHYNVCRHRGSQLVHDCDRGSFAGGIRCPYHSWTYSLEGALRTAPFLEESDGLAKGSLSLHPVAVDSWGAVFVNLSPAAASTRGYTLATQLGAVPERVQRYPLRELRVAHRIRYEVAGELEGPPRELQRVLSLRAGAPRALPAGSGVQAARRLGAGLGAGHPASRGCLDLHHDGHHESLRLCRARRR